MVEVPEQLLANSYQSGPEQRRLGQGKGRPGHKDIQISEYTISQTAQR